MSKKTTLNNIKDLEKFSVNRIGISKPKKHYFRTINNIFLLFLISFSFILFCHFFSRGFLIAENIIYSYCNSVNKSLLNYWSKYSGVKIVDASYTDDHLKDAYIIAEEEAKKRDVSPQIIKAILKTESSKKQLAVSPKGALGLMQVMPANAKFCGYADPATLLYKRENIKCGVAIFESELARYKGDVYHALQAYNGGPKCVSKCREAIQYAQNVINLSATIIE